MRIFLKTEDEIDKMRKSSQLASMTLGEVGRHIKPEVTVLQLDRVADEFIRGNGAAPTFKNFNVVHGASRLESTYTSVGDVAECEMPEGSIILREGDVISVDCGVILDGYNGDCCYTFCVGEVAPEVRNLLRVTKESLYQGIGQAVAGSHVGSIGFAIQKHAASFGYAVVRDVTGYGIGRNRQEEPVVLSCGRFGDGILLKNGMCITVKPMLTMGNAADELTGHKPVSIRNIRCAAHFGHTVVVRKGKAEILSSFEKFE